MAVLTWNMWTSERALRTAGVLLQGTTASSLLPVGSQKEISGTESHCEGSVAASVRNVSGSSAEDHERAWKWLHVCARTVPAPPWGCCVPAHPGVRPCQGQNKGLEHLCVLGLGMLNQVL